MALINELYAPTHLLVCIGGRFTMGPMEAAYAVKKFFTHRTFVYPMHFGTFPLLPGTQEEFEAELAKIEDNQSFKVVKAYEEGLGKWIEL